MNYSNSGDVMKETRIDPSTLVWREDNPNKMDPEKLEKLTEIIGKLGFLQPILAREMGDGTVEIVDGHHRVRAALMNELPLIDAKILEEGDDAHEYAALLQISMNNLRGRLDLNATGLAFTELIECGFDMSDLELTGFTRAEIDDLVEATSLEEDDVLDAATLPEEDAIEDEAPPKPFRIEIEFEIKSDFQAARKALKKAAGAGNPLSVGLLNLIGAQE